MKSIVDFRVEEVSPCGDRAVLLRLSAPGAMPECVPGQFVQVRVDGSKDTFLRRPISIHWADSAAGELWLLVQLVGEGTRALSRLRAGDSLNVVMPLGNGFSGLDALRAAAAEPRPLLVGGGVGVAPLYYYGAWLKARGVEPTFLLGARSKGCCCSWRLSRPSAVSSSPRRTAATASGASSPSIPFGSASASPASMSAALRP